MNIQKRNNNVIKAKDITIIGLMVAVIEASKLVLSQIPNVELTSFWIIMFTIYFGKRILCVIPVFILIEGIIFGFGLWWIMYLYIWPLLAAVAWLLQKRNMAWDWAIVSGIFGLSFGFLCAIPYIFTSGLYSAFAWWVAGIPWDLVHGISNFAIMLVLYKPMRHVMAKTEGIIGEF